MKHAFSLFIGTVIFISSIFALSATSAANYTGTTTVRCSDRNIACTSIKVKWKKARKATRYHVVLTDTRKKILQEKSTGKTVAAFKSLKKNTYYLIHVTPYKENSKGKRSNVLKIKTLSNILDRKNVFIIGDSIQEDKNRIQKCYFVKRACIKLGAHGFSKDTTGHNSRNDSYGDSRFPYLKSSKPSMALRSIKRRITRRKSIPSCRSVNGPRFNNKPVDFTKYDIVIIAAGTNDHYYSLPLRKVRASLADVVQHIYRQNKRIKFIFVTPIYKRQERDENDNDAKNKIGLTLQDYRDELTDFANHLPKVKKYVISGTDISSYSRISDKTYSKDGVHPRANYAKELARSFADKVKALML